MTAALSQGFNMEIYSLTNAGPVDAGPCDWAQAPSNFPLFAVELNSSSPPKSAGHRTLDWTLAARQPWHAC